LGTNIRQNQLNSSVITDKSFKKKTFTPSGKAGVKCNLYFFEIRERESVQYNSQNLIENAKEFSIKKETGNSKNTD
jgi:hypothetical protein